VAASFKTSKGLERLEHWNRGPKSRSGHECMFVMSYSNTENLRVL